MLAHARREANLECCGLLAGRDGVISRPLPACNILGSATRYEISSDELFSLFRQIRAQRLDHLGIYHSHPGGDNSPSQRDIELAYYPESNYFVLSPRPDSPNPARAFRIADGKSFELKVEIV